MIRMTRLHLINWHNFQDDIIDFKKYTIVDNDRPKVCADRIDGVILTGFGWVKNVSKEDIRRIIQDMTIFKNEFDEDEIGFKSYDIARKVLEVSEDEINYYNTTSTKNGFDDQKKIIKKQESTMRRL